MFSNDIKERDDGPLFTIKHLEPCRVRMSEMWHAQREKCACVRVRSGVLSNTPRRVQGSCHCLDAKSRKKSTTNQQLWLFSC